MWKMGFTLGGMMLLATLGLGLHPALAQYGAPPPPPGARRPPPPSPARTLQLWTSVLGLSTDEQAAIKPILQKEQDDSRSVMQNPNLAPQDRMAQMNAIHTAANTAVRAALTTDQQPRFDALQSLMGITRPRPPRPGGPGAFPPQPPAPPSPTQILPLWKTILGLSAEEQAAIKPVLQKEYDETEAVLKDDSIPPPAKMGQINAIHAQSNAEVGTSLTADQRQLFDTLQSQMRPRRPPMGGPGFGPPRGGGPGFGPPPGGPGFGPPPGGGPGFGPPPGQ
ncbi:MAG TPA: hypothetical protein VFJ58_02475 [Armatimonadota bacterium]|nr:hypothetical protein [Armatimonadota bacterium]